VREGRFSTPFSLQCGSIVTDQGTPDEVKLNSTWERAGIALSAVKANGSGAAEEIDP
jgi:hypothetical protein